MGKLRAHFGDKAGALDAVKQGLKLEPGDYEFLTLQKEIKAGATLEQMEYHWINPDADQTLQQGLDEMRMINNAPWPVFGWTKRDLPNFMNCSTQSGIAIRKIPPAVNSNTR